MSFIGLAKATFYHWKNRLDEVNLDQDLINEIRDIFEGNYEAVGYRYINQELRAGGKVVNHKKIQRLKRENNIQCKVFTRKSRKYNSYKGTVGTTAKNKIRKRFYTTVPHQKITTDTTEFKYYIKDNAGNMQVKKLYLDPFMDMFNSEILSYRISTSPNAKAIMEGLEEAIQITSDCPFRRTFHSDQGWGYQMKAYVRRLKYKQIFQSMSRKGNCLDNSLMENFFSILKQSMYYGKVFHSFEELKLAIQNFIHYYNHKRRKAKLNWLSPVEYRLKYVS